MDMQSHFFDSGPFMPHGGCYLWTTSLIVLHAVSDGFIGLAYYSIPFTLVYFVRKRRDLKFHWMFVCFAVFILACGTTHLMEIWNIWHANYWLSGGIKALTALASVPTAVLLMKLVPKALALPSADALQKARDELEQRVAERTRQLAEVNESLTREIRERKWLASFPEQNPNPIIELDANGMVHYQNPTATVLFPDLSGQGLAHPYLAGLTGIMAELRGNNPGVVRREVSAGSLCFSQTISYVPESRRVRIYSTDITERKIAEEQLRGSLREVNDLKTALDEHAIVAITDPQGKITYVNDKFCAISKYSHDELIGQDHRLINSGHHPKEFIRDLWATIAGGKIWKGEIKNRAKDGTYYWVDTTIVPFLNADGKPRQYVAIRADITERQKAAEALRQSEVKFAKAFANNPAAIALTRLHDGTILEVNDTWVKLCGCDRAEIVGRSARMMWPSLEAAAEFVRELTGKGVVRGREQEFRKKNGDIFTAEFSCQLLDFDGEKVLLSTLVDITSRKRAEAEIHQLNAELERRVRERTMQLEAANKELEAFSYSVSHDLRAPLRAVNGFADIVLEDYGGNLPEDGHRYLQRIRDGGRRMGVLIDDLLAFARLSRQQFHRQFVDMEKLVQHVLKELEPQMQGRAINISVGRLPAAHGDSALLGQVWINLLSNAIKYSRDRAPAEVEIGGLSERGLNVYFVRDNGTGFDMRYADKLFGVFQRLHRPDEFEGTGVGLAIVQRIVHRHGGQVWAEAKVDAGATFYFTLEEEKKHEHSQPN